MGWSNIFNGLKMGFIRSTSSWVKEIGEEIFFPRKRIVRSTSPKFPVKWVFPELFNNLRWNLFYRVSKHFEVSRKIDRYNTPLTGGCLINDIDCSICMWECFENVEYRNEILQLIEICQGAETQWITHSR